MHISVQCNESLFSWALPCPDEDRIRWALAIGSEPEQTQPLLASNPALLIDAAAKFYAHHRSPPASCLDLQRWCETQPLSTWNSLGDQDQANKIPTLVSVDSVKRFLQARTNVELRKALVAFIRESTDFRKKIAKKIIRQILGREFTVYGSELLSRRQRKQRRAEILTAWSSPAARSLDVSAILQLRIRLANIEQDFTSQLSRQKLAAMKELAYGASHEINNPLANIATRAQTLLKTETDPERQHKLAVIYEQALRAHEMISDLMLFANPPGINRVNTDLRLWAAAIVHEVSTSLLTENICSASESRPAIDLQVRFGPNVRGLNMDPTHLSVAIKSLLRNSIESIRARSGTGSILFRICTDRSNAICFEVIDDGVGVSETAQIHMFDPFFSGREAGRGLGFGLSKAWRIAELHGGDLQFDGQHSPGARFILKIPAESAGTGLVTRRHVDGERNGLISSPPRISDVDLSRRSVRKTD